MINRRGFGLFALGALLFCAVFYFATTRHILGWPEDGDEGAIKPYFLIALYTIAFGLPYAIGELTRRTNWLAVLYVLVLIPVAHLGAIAAFIWYTNEGETILGGENATLIPGLLAGAVGAIISFLFVLIPGLRSKSAGIAVFLSGIVLLTACAGISMKVLPFDDLQPLDVVLKLFLPWQLIFAFFLSAMLRPSPARGTVATTEAATD